MNNFACLWLTAKLEPGYIPIINQSLLCMSLGNISRFPWIIICCEREGPKTTAKLYFEKKQQQGNFFLSMQYKQGKKESMAGQTIYNLLIFIMQYAY